MDCGKNETLCYWKQNIHSKYNFRHWCEYKYVFKQFVNSKIFAKVFFCIQLIFLRFRAILLIVLSYFLVWHSSHLFSLVCKKQNNKTHYKRNNSFSCKKFVICFYFFREFEFIILVPFARTNILLWYRIKHIVMSEIPHYRNHTVLVINILIVNYSQGPNTAMEKSYVRYSQQINCCRQKRKKFRSSLFCLVISKFIMYISWYLCYFNCQNVKKWLNAT